MAGLLLVGGGGDDMSSKCLGLDVDFWPVKVRG